MTFIVTDACIRCKHMDCVEVCPTGAFREGENMLVIDPDACIDCNLYPPECPVDAILPDIDPGQERWLELNASFAKKWPEITIKRDAPADADEHKGEPGKFEKYFSSKPGEGD
jgi:ferredoxin